MKVMVINTVSILYFTVEGEEKQNYEESKLLCNVFTAATESLRKAKNKRQLTDAIYGAGGSIKFRDDGSIEKDGNFFGQIGWRSVLCDYHEKDVRLALRARSNGCLAESLVGTFSCVCTPGDKNAQGLCGMKDLGSFGTWSGSFSGNELNQTLFKGVWNKLNEICNDGSENEQDYREKLKNLRRSVERIRRKIEASNGIGSLVLGQGRRIPCSGETTRHICAVYQEESGRPDTPWVKKIEVALGELEKKADATNVVPESGAARKGPIGTNKQNREATPSREIEENEEPQEPMARLPNIHRETDDQTEEEDPQSEITGSRGSFSGEPTERGKRTTKKPHITDIPHVATNPNEDGFFLNHPKVVLWAVLFN
ncbi:Variant surface glycoprotein [Trypanosoma congolense IL3000]|uniref:Variant surface glycoprotein n=1 Tax=Trypanosoma congolense (strain IL3000) TaxID=1068625 RepID=F9W546_TRYCI|nr:Variant surface glycoprotein [Trypanosoma congolense IL3000]